MTKCVFHEQLERIDCLSTRNWILESPFSDSAARGGGGILPGFVLLAAGFLKFHEFLSGPVRTFGAGMIPHRFLFAVGTVEAILGVYLLLTRAKRPIVAFAIVVFSAFFVINLNSLMIDQPDCGCFGKMRVPPWVALTVDTLCLGTLVALSSQRRPREGVQNGHFVPSGFSTLLLIVCGFGLGAVVSSPLGQGAIQSVAQWGTVHASADPRTVWVNPSDSVVLPVRFVNGTRHDVTLIGRQGSCGLRFGPTFPIRLPPGRTVFLPASFRAPKEVGVFAIESIVFTDARASPVVPVSVYVRVISDSPSKEPIHGSPLASLKVPVD